MLRKPVCPACGKHLHWRGIRYSPAPAQKSRHWYRYVPADVFCRHCCVQLHDTMAGKELILRFLPFFVALVANRAERLFWQQGFLAFALVALCLFFPFVLLWLYISYRPDRYTLWNDEKN